MIYYDFHIHSCLSPCGDMDMTPNNIVNMAVLSELDAIAVCDHNSARNVRAVMEVAKLLGITVIPGMEVETAEEVHILTLFPTIEACEYAESEIYKALPEIKNRPEIFGHQTIMDCEDNIIGYEEKLLITPTSLSINRLYDLIKSSGGQFIPAHLDRHSYSILTNLGFMPDDLDISHIEISKGVEDLGLYLNNRPELKNYKILRNSDAHYLENIAIKDSCINSISELFKRNIK